tara:strand:+ start:1438 stop:1602 length:165 start_codon:yes stop_codon:yes gene_type:complete
VCSKQSVHFDKPGDSQGEAKKRRKKLLVNKKKKSKIINQNISFLFYLEWLQIFL